VLVALRPWAGPQMAVEPQRLVFGGTPIGSSSETQTITVRNTGSATLHVGSPSLQGDDDFSLSDDCGQGLVEPGQSCRIGVRLTPGQGGERIAFLTLTSDGSDQPVQVPLVGSGTPVEWARLEPDPPFLDFEQPSTEVVALPVALRSTGERPAEIRSIATDSPVFTADTGCEGRVLARGESCVVDVSFRPDSVDSTTAWLVVGHDGPHEELRIPLRGVAFPAEPPSLPPPPGRVAVSPEVLSFEGLRGQPPAERPLKIANVGDGPLRLLSTDVVEGQSSFVVRGACPGRLEPRGACVLWVGVGLDRPGELRGSLAIRSDDRTIDVPLLAEIREPGRPRVSVSPRGLAFDEQGAVRGGGRGGNLVTVANEGDGPLLIERYATSDARRFAVSLEGTTRPCREGLELGPGERCELRVLLNPGGTGPGKGSLLIFDNADSSPQRVFLVAERHSPGLGNLQVGRFDPNFGPVLLGSLRRMKASRVGTPPTTPSKAISLANLGPGPLRVTISEPSDPDFRLDRGACESRALSRGEGCQITVAFDPRRTGPIWASVLINHDGSGGPQRLDFQGEGTNPNPQRLAPIRGRSEVPGRTVTP
jgi:hypothetical protein